VTRPAPAASVLGGVRYGRIERHGDSRGSFRELWRATAFGDVPPADARLDVAVSADVDATEGLHFVQANLSTSDAGVLRGLHLHRRQLDHWVVASGRAFVALVDVRPIVTGSGRSAIVETRILDADDTVTIPSGVAHGFLALEPLELVYFVTNAYDGSDELGFAWDDPTAGVPWPPVPGRADGRPILSDRDAANPSLADLLGRLQG